MPRTASSVDRPTRPQHSWLAPLAALCVVAFAGDAHAQVAFRTVAASGDPAPGIDGGKLTFPQVPTISVAGHVAFTSELEDGSGSGHISVWLSDATGLHLVARDGAAMPEGPSFDSLHGFVFHSLPVQTDWLPFRGTQDGVVGLFARDGGALRPLVRTGDTIGARTVGTLNEFVASNGQGDTLAVDDGNAVFHVARDGTRTLLVEQMTECGGPGGACGTLMPLISDAGHVFTPTRPKGGEMQLRFGMPGALAVLAEVGQSGPGFAPAEKWSSFQRVGLGKDGSLVLAAGVGNEDTLESWSGIWTKSPNGELTRIDKLPLTLGSSTLHRIERVHVAGASEYVLTGYDDTDPPNPRELIVARRAGRFELVAKAKDPAPGASPARFFDFLGGAYVNAKGEVLFHARLEADDGSVVGQRNNTGLWVVRPPSTTPELLVRAGAPLDLGGGRGIVTPYAVRIVPMLGAAGGGKGMPFNDAGEVAFEIGYPTISDAVIGSAVLVSGAPAPPEVGRADLALVVERLDDSVLHPRAPNERALPLRIRVKNNGTDLAASVRLSFVRKTEPGAPLLVASPISNAQTPPPVWLCGSEPGGSGARHECRGAALRPNEELVGEVFLETDVGTVTIEADVPGEEDPTPADNSYDLHLFDHQSALQRDREGGSCGCSTPAQGPTRSLLFVLPAVAALAWRRRQRHQLGIPLRDNRTLPCSAAPQDCTVSSRGVRPRANSRL